MEAFLLMVVEEGNIGLVLPMMCYSTLLIIAIIVVSLCVLDRLSIGLLNEMLEPHSNYVCLNVVIIGGIEEEVSHGIDFETWRCHMDSFLAYGCLGAKLSPIP